MRVIRGAPGSGKTALAYGEFAEALREGTANLRLVVPTATLVRHTQHELARRGLVFSPNSVLSLSRFARERAGASAEAGLVPEGLLRAFVRDTLSSLKLPDFAGVAATGGMVDVVIDTIHLMENAGGTPKRLAEVRALSSVARAFLRVWQTVDEAVRRSGFLTRGAMFRAAAACQQPATVWMDGFLHLSPLEADLVRAVASTCDLTVTLGMTDASDEMHRLCIELRARDTTLPGARRAPTAIVVAAASPEREAAEMARRTIEIHAAGTPLRQIAVAVRDTETYVPLLRAAFDRFGIPARFYFPLVLRHHPAAIFLNGLLDGVLDGWDFEATLRAFRAHPRWGTSTSFDRFDFAVREQMPAHGASEFLALAGTGWLGDRLGECLRIGAWKQDRLLPADWARRCGKMATSLYRPGTPEPATTSTEDARSHSAALSAWIHAVESVTEFWQDGERAITLGEFWPVAREAVETARFHVADDRANVVHVMGVQEARQWNLHTLMVCGVTDRDFPQRQAENLIFPDRDIDRLRKAGMPVRKADRDGAGRDKEEQWLFQTLQTRATGNLMVTYPRRDIGGRGVERSRYIDTPVIAAEAAPRCRPVLAAEAESTGVAGRIESRHLLEQVAGLHRSVSPTGLESLVQCPFQFFAGKTLMLKPAPDRPQERLQARITGTILHEALEKWQTRRDRDFVEVFEETFEDTCRRKHLPAGYKLEVERFLLRNIARQVGATEKWKTPDRTLVEETFELPFLGDITVKGRIDRIDVFGNDCVVIDYKSSKTANVQRLVESEAKLQGPIYALAARDHLHLNPVAMAFWAVREDRLFGWGEIPGYKGYRGKALEPMPENWADDARARAGEQLSAYLGGNAAVRPADESQCRWCDFAAACRVETQRKGMTAGATNA